MPNSQQLLESLRHSEEQFRSMIEKSADGVIVLCPGGDILYANPTATTMFRRTSEELVGANFGEPLMHGETTEVNLLGVDGEQRIAELRCVEISWKRKPAFLCTLRDVTDIRNAEVAARKTVRNRDEFLAMLSHELRNPLSAISNAAQLVEQTASDNPQVVLATQTLHRQVHHMSRLLDDLIEVSRVTQGKINLRFATISAQMALEEAVRTVSPAAKEHCHNLTVSLCETPLYIDADPTRFQQVLVNLLNNAIKYTPAGGELSVALQPAGDNLEIVIEDNGLGIHPDDIDNIFDLFVQTERSIDRSQGGLGVGLTLVRQLLELHGGQIRAESLGEGTGTRMFVTLPLTIEQPAEAEEPTSMEETKGRVLVVEDMPDNREMLRALLEFDGFQVDIACDGLEAIEVFKKNPPRIAIVDIGLPKISGYEVARRLRNDPGYQDILLVALTGYGQDSDREEALNAGFDAHLVKPLDMNKFKSLLHAH